jgi:hypothetical protein
MVLGDGIRDWATSDRQESIERSPQADPSAGNREAGNRVFHQVAENK